MEQGNNHNQEELFSKRVRAGRRRTYFFDVRTTRSNDYYITITESKRKFDEDGYERHKIHLYKEDFNKFLKAFSETVDHVKTDLMPDYDFEEFSRRDEEYERRRKEQAENPDFESSKESTNKEESTDVSNESIQESSDGSSESPESSESIESSSSEDNSSEIIDDGDAETWD